MVPLKDLVITDWSFHELVNFQLSYGSAGRSPLAQGDPGRHPAMTLLLLAGDQLEGGDL